jgi:mRNA-degrading endonuclease RelE of RelBE toxin-antitoxin system
VGDKVSAWLLWVFAGLMFAAAVAVDYAHLDAKVTLCFITGALILAVLGAFGPRISGTVDLLKGRIPIESVRDGEVQAEKGEVVPIEPGFTGHGELTMHTQIAGNGEVGEGGGPKALEAPKPPAPPQVSFTNEAAEQFNQLDEPRRVAVAAALQNLGNDPKFIVRGSGGRSLSMRRLKAEELRIIYRERDKKSANEPDQYVVITIDDKRGQ